MSEPRPSRALELIAGSEGTTDRSEMAPVRPAVAHEAEDEARPILLRDILAAPAPATEWIVPGVLAVGGIGILGAEYYLGKSTLLAGLGAHVGVGRSFLGFDVTRALPVLYWQAEGSRRLFAERVACACFHAGIDIQTLDFAFPPADLLLPFDSADFARFVIESGRKLVIADSLGYFHDGDENSASDWKKRVMKPLMAISRAHGVSFLFAHHYVKPSDNRQGRHKIRGTSAIGADCDLVMRLEAPDGELATERRLIFDKVKDAAEQPALTLSFDKGKALFTREGVAPASDEVGEKRRKLIADMKGRIESTLTAQPNLSGRQLFELTRGSRAIFDAALGELKRDILVIGEPGPRGSILWKKALVSAADRVTE
jgi:hypothetical protein